MESQIERLIRAATGFAPTPEQRKIFARVSYERVQDQLHALNPDNAIIPVSISPDGNVLFYDGSALKALELASLGYRKAGDGTYITGPTVFQRRALRPV